MKIEQQFEMAGFRFRAVIESAELETHSKMQLLNETDLRGTRSSLYKIMQELVNKIKNRELEDNRFVKSKEN